jgi:hypothetical protein
MASRRRQYTAIELSPPPARKRTYGGTQSRPLSPLRTSTPPLPPTPAEPSHARILLSAHDLAVIVAQQKAAIEQLLERRDHYAREADYWHDRTIQVDAYYRGVIDTLASVAQQQLHQQQQQQHNNDAATAISSNSPLSSPPPPMPPPQLTTQSLPHPWDLSHSNTMAGQMNE